MYVVRTPSVPDWDRDGNLTLPYLHISSSLIGHIASALKILLSPHRKFVMDESKADSENHASGSQMDVASSTTMPTKNSNRKRLHQNAIAILEGNHGDHFNALDI